MGKRIASTFTSVNTSYFWLTRRWKIVKEPEPVRHQTEGRKVTSDRTLTWRGNSDMGADAYCETNLSPHTVSTLPFKGLQHQYLSILILTVEVEAPGQHAAFKNRFFSYKRFVYLSLHTAVVIETEKKCVFLCATWEKHEENMIMCVRRQEQK